MRLYNIYYKVKNQVTEKKNMTREEVDAFISRLKQENESELRVSEVKDREEEER